MADPSWIETENGIRWSLLDGDPDREGRGMMFEALSKADLSAMQMFTRGFNITQASDRQQSARFYFDACARQDPKRVYNIGRRLNQQPEI